MNGYVMQSTNLKELTFRGILLGALITVLFTASNVYLGLKVGVTFASSIPAAVISMAVLKFYKDSSILENNMVQTQASSAGTLSSVIFVLPGLLMMGSVLANHVDLCGGRYFGSVIYHSVASCHGGK